MNPNDCEHLKIETCFQYDAQKNRTIFWLCPECHMQFQPKGLADAQLEGEPCSICGTQPALLIDAKEKGTYWMCADCMFESIMDKMKLEAENKALRKIKRTAKLYLEHGEVCLADELDSLLTGESDD